MGGAPISISPMLANLQRRHLRPDPVSSPISSSPISNLQRRHLRPDPVRSPTMVVRTSCKQSRVQNPPKTTKIAVSRPARHDLLQKSDVEHPFFKRSPHIHKVRLRAAPASQGPSREKRRRRCILAVAIEGDSTPLRSEIKL